VAIDGNETTSLPLDIESFQPPPLQILPYTAKGNGIIDYGHLQPPSKPNQLYITKTAARDSTK
jgi:hypothetical protein